MGIKNKLIDLNNHLFEQLERLNDDDLSADQIDKEVKRTDAMVLISKEIIANADLALKTAKLVAEHGAKVDRYLPLIEGKSVEAAKS